MKLAEHSRKIFQDFRASFKIENLSILEIGGHLPEELVLSTGINSWQSISLNCPENITNKCYSALKMDCRNLTFDDHSFDLIYSCAAFEHINNLPIALQEMHRVLKPHGLLYSAFGPIWSSYCGHHIEFNIGNRYHDFNEAIIPNWAHLLMEPAKMAKFLKKKYQQDNIVNELLEQIYHSDRINRWFYEDYLQCFLESDFTIFQLNSFANRFDLPKAEEKKQLLSKFPGKHDFSSYGIRDVLLKI